MNRYQRIKLLIFSNVSAGEQHDLVLHAGFINGFKHLRRNIVFSCEVKIDINLVLGGLESLQKGRNLSDIVLLVFIDLAVTDHIERFNLRECQRRNVTHSGSRLIDSLIVHKNELSVLGSADIKFHHIHSGLDRMKDVRNGIVRNPLLEGFHCIAAVRNNIDAAHREIFLPLLLNSIAEFKQRCGLGIDLSLILIFYYVLGAVARDKCE